MAPHYLKGLMKPLKSNILVPGKGYLDVDALTVDRRIREHDERLRFGFNEKNQDWVIYITMPPDFDASYYIDGGPVYPVIGFGKQIPDPDTALKKLHYADTMRYGLEILDKMNSANDKLKEPYERKASEATGEAADVREWALRKLELHPSPRIFVPAQVTKET